MGEDTILAEREPAPRLRLRRKERIGQILLELKLRPHVRIAELSERFDVSAETIRRDLESLSEEGLVNRAHGGASQPAHRHYPGIDERNRARVEERERIGRTAAALVQPGETLMIDAGSTTLQFARFLAYRGTPCTVLTNSLSVATALGHSADVSVVLCPGEYLSPENAVIGPDAIEFIARHSVRRCFIGASSVSETGVYETVRGFAAIKRAILAQARESVLLADCSKFRAPDMTRVAALDDLTAVVVDRIPYEPFAGALAQAGVQVLVAGEDTSE
ncbi:MAG: DeoR/GlpR transcriptional regulator [Pseudooceanicola sp.]|nr:DeoR/GlpR transcriptional regulator [Pseudooceanicola sp.]